MAFLTNSDQDIKKMLKSMNIDNFEQLISNIPADLRTKKELNLPEAVSEYEIELKSMK